MSTLTAAPTTLSPEPSQSRSRAAGDDRAPFDDLIDQYATSYTAHHTDPPPFDDGHSDRDPPLYPLSQHQSNYSEISFKDVKGLEEHTTQRLDWEYPPPKTKPDTKVEKESRTSCWEIVRAAVRERECGRVAQVFSPYQPVHTRFHRVSIVPLDHHG